MMQIIEVEVNILWVTVFSSCNFISWGTTVRQHKCQWQSFYPQRDTSCCWIRLWNVHKYDWKRYYLENEFGSLSISLLWNCTYRLMNAHFENLWLLFWEVHHKHKVKFYGLQLNGIFFEKVHQVVVLGCF